jgi:hypothetical protein
MSANHAPDPAPSNPATPASHAPLGDLLKPLKRAPMLRRINGIGYTLAGAFNEPTVAGAYYKQTIFTIFFFPVAWGRIYLVKSTGNRSWSMFGSLRGGDFIRRFGWGGYARLKATILLESLLFFVFGAGLLVLLAVVLHRR